MSLPWSPLRTIKLDANSLVDIACISFTCVQIFIIILFIHYQQHFTCNFGTISNISCHLALFSTFLWEQNTKSTSGLFFLPTATSSHHHLGLVIVNILELVPSWCCEGPIYSALWARVPRRCAKCCCVWSRRRKAFCECCLLWWGACLRLCYHSNKSFYVFGTVQNHSVPSSQIFESLLYFVVPLLVSFLDSHF